MKKTTLILFLGYFGLFVLIGIIFFNKYLDRYLKSGAEPAEVQVIPKERIYYASANELWVLNPETTSNIALRTERVQSTGEVNFVDIETNYFVYAAKPANGDYEIWEVNRLSNSSEKIIDASNPALTDYQNFLKPKYSPDLGKIAFVARNESKDSLFLFDRTNKTIVNLTTETVGHFSDFSWKPDGRQLIYCTNDLQQNHCQVTTTSAEKTQTLELKVAQIEWVQNDLLVYLGEGNIFSLKSGTTPIQLTFLSAPKSVSKFVVASSMIAYEVKENDVADIYSINVDGTSNIQLTNNYSFQPLISPKGDQVAYLTTDGVYITSSHQPKGEKVINLSEPIELLKWR